MKTLKALILLSLPTMVMADPMQVKTLDDFTCVPMSVQNKVGYTHMEQTNQLQLPCNSDIRVFRQLMVQPKVAALNQVSKFYVNINQPEDFVQSDIGVLKTDSSVVADYVLSYVFDQQDFFEKQRAVVQGNLVFTVKRNFGAFNGKIELENGAILNVNLPAVSVPTTTQLVATINRFTRTKYGYGVLAPRSLTSFKLSFTPLPDQEIEFHKVTLTTQK